MEKKEKKCLSFLHTQKKFSEQNLLEVKSEAMRKDNKGKR